MIDASAGNTGSLYKETFDILRPEMQKIKELMDFSNGVQATFCNTVKVREALTWLTLSAPPPARIGCRPRLFAGCTNPRWLCRGPQRLTEVQWKSPEIPEPLFVALIRLLDLLQKLDNLKDTKASLNNDFARFKRCVGPACRRGGNASEAVAVPVTRAYALPPMAMAGPGQPPRPRWPTGRRWGRL